MDLYGKGRRYKVDGGDDDDRLESPRRGWRRLGELQGRGRRASRVRDMDGGGSLLCSRRVWSGRVVRVCFGGGGLGQFVCLGQQKRARKSPPNEKHGAGNGIGGV